MGEDIERQLCHLFDEALEIDEDLELLSSGDDTSQTAKLSYRDIEYELSVVNHPDGDFGLIDAPDCPDARIYQLPTDASKEHIEDVAEELYQRCQLEDV